MNVNFKDIASLADDAARLLAEFANGSIEDSSRPDADEVVSQLTELAGRLRVMEGGKPIDRVRDAEFAYIDQPRAADALRRLRDASEGTLDDCVELNDAEASEIVAMLESPEYYHLIAVLTDDR